MEIPIKSKKEIEYMHRGGQIAAQIKKELVQRAKVGVSTSELDQVAEQLILEAGAKPSFKGHEGYPKSIVTCINQEVVHGIPSERKLKDGDLLTIDLGVYYRGFHVDTAVSLTVGGDKMQPDKHRDFLAVGQHAVGRAIKLCRAGRHVGDLSASIQETVEKSGWNVIRTFVGHGVGRRLHEPPQIPCFGQGGTGEILRPGMALAVEVMYSAGSGEVEILSDGWTAVTPDRSLSAMFEETVVVTKREPLLLTR